MLFLCEIIDRVLEARWLNGSCRGREPTESERRNLLSMKNLAWTALLIHGLLFQA